MSTGSNKRKISEDASLAKGQFAARQIEKDIAQLGDALLTLNTPEEALSFIKDICTPSEIRAIAERLEVARLLDIGELSYREIYEKTGVSTTTVTRVARFLFHETHQGYRLVLDRLKD
ncbi:MAG: YerC/YecD family TrpR-related protein [Sphingomonadales bacterium]